MRIQVKPCLCLYTQFNLQRPDVFILDGKPVIPNTLVETLPTLGPSYRVYLNLYINSFDGTNLKGGKWAELLRFTTTENNCCSIGSRIPAIFTNKGGFIQVATQLGTSGNNWKNVNSVNQEKTWYRLEILQFAKNDKVFYFVCYHISIFNIFNLFYSISFKSS